MSDSRDELRTLTDETFVLLENTLIDHKTTLVAQEVG